MAAGSHGRAELGLPSESVFKPARTTVHIRRVRSRRLKSEIVALVGCYKHELGERDLLALGTPSNTVGDEGRHLEHGTV